MKLTEAEKVLICDELCMTNCRNTKECKRLENIEQILTEHLEQAERKLWECMEKQCGMRDYLGCDLTAKFIDISKSMDREYKPCTFENCPIRKGEGK